MRLGAGEIVSALDAEDVVEDALVFGFYGLFVDWLGVTFLFVVCERNFWVFRVKTLDTG